MKKLRVLFEPNVGPLDRWVRAFLAECSILAAFFWIGGIWSWILYVIGALLLIQALFGYCALYKALNISTYERKRKVAWYRWIPLIIIWLALGVGIAYGSMWATSQFFISDFNTANRLYKQTLYATNLGDREASVLNYSQFVDGYASFSGRYGDFRPWMMRTDVKMNADIKTAGILIQQARDGIYKGDTAKAHKILLGIRPIFLELLRRNNFSPLKFALVDLKEGMEFFISAAEKGNFQAVIRAYEDVDNRLHTVEESTDDARVPEVRKNLDRLYGLAKAKKGEEAKTQAGILKEAFQSLYLERGL